LFKLFARSQLTSRISSKSWRILSRTCCEFDKRPWSPGGRRMCLKALYPCNRCRISTINSVPAPGIRVSMRTCLCLYGKSPNSAREGVTYRCVCWQWQQS